MFDRFWYNNYMEGKQRKEERMATFHKGYKFRLYPTTKQTTLINKTIGSCRYVFNWALGNITIKIFIGTSLKKWFKMDN